MKKGEAIIENCSGTVQFLNVYMIQSSTKSGTMHELYLHFVMKYKRTTAELESKEFENRSSVYARHQLAWKQARRIWVVWMQGVICHVDEDIYFR